MIDKTINVQQLSLFGQISEIEEEYEDIDCESIKNMKNEKIDEIIYDIENKDVNNMTPMEALAFLSEIKSKLEEKK